MFVIAGNHYGYEKFGYLRAGNQYVIKIEANPISEKTFELPETSMWEKPSSKSRIQSRNGNFLLVPETSMSEAWWSCEARSS